MPAPACRGSAAGRGRPFLDMSYGKAAEALLNQAARGRLGAP